MIEKLPENISPLPQKTVTLKLCGNVAEIKSSLHINSEPPILKVDENEFIYLRDTKDGKAMGEVGYFSHGETRQDDKTSVKQFLERLRDYINTNVLNVANCVWLTLTYAENMTDTDRLYKDFKAFNRRCRKKYGHYEYIVSAEPQARGAWHLHCIFIFGKKAPFLANAEVRALWKNGFVNVRKLDNNIDDIGRYLTAYLGDMALDDMENKPDGATSDSLKIIRQKDGQPPKAVIKGARLSLYPSGFHLYRISKGIKPPDIAKMPNQEAERLLADWTKTHEATYRVYDETRDFENIVNKRFYNRLRGKIYDSDK